MNYIYESGHHRIDNREGRTLVQLTEHADANFGFRLADLLNEVAREDVEDIKEELDGERRENERLEARLEKLEADLDEAEDRIVSLEDQLEELASAEASDEEG